MILMVKDSADALRALGVHMHLTSRSNTRRGALPYSPSRRALLQTKEFVGGLMTKGVNSNAYSPSPPGEGE